MRVRNIEVINKGSDGVAPPSPASPQTYIRYDKEVADDLMLAKVQQFCFDYVSGLDISGWFSLDDIVQMQEFIAEKYVEYTSLKKSLKLTDDNGLIKSISYKVDMATLGGSFTNKSDESLHPLLSKEINTLLGILATSGSILDNILDVMVRVSLSEEENEEKELAN